MRIRELIEALARIASEHGDLPVGVEMDASGAAQIDSVVLQINPRPPAMPQGEPWPESARNGQDSRLGVKFVTLVNMSGLR